MAIPERRLATRMRRMASTLMGTVVTRITTTTTGSLEDTDSGEGEGVEVESGVELMEDE